MNYHPDRHHRRSIRLPGYDYSQSGWYFVTICSYKKQCIFGDIKVGKICLNYIGTIVREEWLKSAQMRQEVELDEWIIMPNHIHGIVVIVNGDLDTNGAQALRSYKKPRSLSSFIGGFKSSVTKRIKEFSQQPSPPVWQRNYYESIVRNERHLNQIRQYIIDNPQKWDEDPEKPQNQSQDIFIDLLF
ncbi:transposase [Lyngbya sp. CCY1209]|uniref:transposase n=1 Tax=Lyngbya sp. CCY1209 TaxID=2886103 RepID=UPI002D1FE88A|nr:transposase [Lyngbya sp. CCY1209]MEB3883672.1 transposase [Lyngbya sp. CCY1209]